MVKTTKGITSIRRTNRSIRHSQYTSLKRNSGQLYYPGGETSESFLPFSPVRLSGVVDHKCFSIGLPVVLAVAERRSALDSATFLGAVEPAETIHELLTSAPWRSVDFRGTIHAFKLPAKPGVQFA
jgi:hypothetical protein